jgi:methyl-accepting chemotaxis protein
MKGCFDYLSAKNPGIVLTGVFEGAGNRDATAVTCADMLAAHPDINLVYITDGHTPVAAAEVIAKANRGIKMVVFDAMPENIGLLKSSRVSCLIEQNSFAQAWNALVHLYNSCETVWRPVTPKFFMEPITITMKNYQTYWDDANNRRIMKDDEKAQLANPSKNTSGKKYRFGLILPLSTGFFEGLGRGADAAREALKPYGVSVEVLDVFEDWNNFGSVKLFGPVIEKFIKEKYDGFATVVVDPAVVKEINKAVAGGMKVTTFNTEPSNFREIILSIMDNITLLSRESQELAAAAEKSSRANEQIGSAILGIRNDIREEKNRISANDAELKTLTGKIHGVQDSLGQYSSLVGKMSDESMRGAKSMDETWKDTQYLKNVIDSIVKELASFQGRLSKITEFTAVIEALAENTNVLAINASIQAARAGTAGKSFAVVAGEIRTLAGNSHRTAEDIRALVTEITGLMDALTKTSAQGSQRMTANMDQTLLARKSFESIVSVIQDANNAIGSIEDSVKGIVSAGNCVQTNMEAIETMSDTSASRLEEISSSVGELSAQSGNLSETAARLSTMTSSQESVFSQLSVRE